MKITNKLQVGEIYKIKWVQSDGTGVCLWKASVPFRIGNYEKFSHPDEKYVITEIVNRENRGVFSFYLVYLVCLNDGMKYKCNIWDSQIDSVFEQLKLV